MRVWSILFGLVGVLIAAPVVGQEIVSARFDAPTTRYAHLVLGRDHNFDVLALTLSNGTRQRVQWPDLVFEDTAPRLVDMDGYGAPEVIVVESGEGKGGRVAIYGLVHGKVTLRAVTPHIGQSNRWHAVVGAADLDGDGAVEFAFVDRPHLAKILRVWRFDPIRNTVAEVATLSDVTNHRIGDPEISSGIRTCGTAPEIVLHTGDWNRLVGVTLRNGALEARDLGTYSGPKSMDAARDCAQ